MTSQFNIENGTFSGIGLMSGTSLDGLDIAFCHFTRKNDVWRFSIDHSATIDYPAEIFEKLKSCKEFDERTLNLFDAEYGRFIGRAVQEFCTENLIKPQFVASHGHTVFHDPAKGFTKQIGSGSAIAKEVGIIVVNDFRTADMLLGGQGAPLVPIGDIFLFREYKYCLNLGGIANISEKFDEGIRAFDIGICNIGFNYLANLTGLNFDKDGDMGRKGILHLPTLENLNQLEYYILSAPKSLDASFFVIEMLDILNRNNLSVNDQITTLYHHVASQIANIISDKNKEILVTGGGAHNAFLIETLTSYGLNVNIPGKELVDFKEAMIFCFMGLLKLLGKNNILSQVTGTPKDHSSGTIHFPYKRS